MTILAIDPGTEKSGWVKMDESYRIIGAGEMSNEDMRGHISGCAFFDTDPRLVIERIANMGMPAVGDSVFETCVWTGRFVEVFSGSSSTLKTTRIPRNEIQIHLCGSTRAKDANIRQSLIDRYGGSAALQKYRQEKRNRKGEVTRPEVEAGALAGVSGHAWAALAVAVVYLDRVKAGVT